MKRLWSSLFGVVALAFAGAASANMITVDVSTIGAMSGDRIVNCTGEDCQGFLDEDYTGGEVNATFDDFGKLVLSDVEATPWELQPSNETTIGGFLNQMLDELGRDQVDLTTVFKTDGNFQEFSTTREYFWVKQDKWTAFFVNPNPGQLVTVKISGGDISNYGVAGVPIPAAFVLFGSGLVGLGWLARRQRARKDSVGQPLTA